MQQFNFRYLKITGAITALALGSGLIGLGLNTQAQDQVSQDQNAALNVIAKMTEGQRTYYQKNGQFRAPINDNQKRFRTHFTE